jgi:hypothetical protein
MSQAGAAGATGGGFVPPLTVPLGGTGAVTLTDHSLVLAHGALPLTGLGAATNGQIPIGSTGADPVLATITAGAGIGVAIGAGTITITNTGTSTITYTPVTAVMSPYVVLAADCFLAVDTTGGPVTIRLPNAATAGRVLYIKDALGNAAVNAITVTTPGGVVLIDAAATYTINLPWESISVVGSGTAYKVF